MIALLLLHAGPPVSHAVEAYKKLWDEHSAKRLPNDDLSRRLLAHARRYPKDGTALQALNYVAGGAKYFKTTLRPEARRLLLEEWALAPWIGPILGHAASEDSGREFLHRVGERHPSKRTRALAYRQLIDNRTYHLGLRERLLAKPETIKELSGESIAESRREIAGWRKDIAEAHAKLQAPDLKGAIPDLSVGSEAPATPTRTLSGEEVSLASLRGKVVVLDFWFIKCGPCRAVVPKANALLKEMERRPFVQVGVNVDESLAEVRAFLKKGSMPWTHWVADWKSPFLVDLDIRTYPTIYVIDHKGIIRHRQVGFDPKDDKITPLVRELVKKAERK